MSSISFTAEFHQGISNPRNRSKISSIRNPNHLFKGPAQLCQAYVSSKYKPSSDSKCNPRIIGGIDSHVAISLPTRLFQSLRDSFAKVSAHAIS
jgi:hypothetical protein